MDTISHIGDIQLFCAKIFVFTKNAHTWQAWPLFSQIKFSQYVSLYKKLKIYSPRNFRTIIPLLKIILYVISPLQIKEWWDEWTLELINKCFFFSYLCMSCYLHVTEWNHLGKSIQNIQDCFHKHHYSLIYLQYIH